MSTAEHRSRVPPGNRPLPVRILRGIGRALVTVAVVAYTVFSELLLPLLRPLLRWLSALRLFETLGALIRRLPPYVVLVLLAVPFVIIEPVKVFAIYWGAIGHPVQGLLLLVLAQVLSILTCDRIYHAGHEPLMRIGWFRRFMTWLKTLRDRALDWAKATAAWRSGAALAHSVRLWFGGILASRR